MNRVRSIVKEVVEIMGRLDILVNNAGITQLVPATDLEGMTGKDSGQDFCVEYQGHFFLFKCTLSGEMGHIGTQAKGTWSRC